MIDQGSGSVAGDKWRSTPSLRLFIIWRAVQINLNCLDFRTLHSLKLHITLVRGKLPSMLSYQSTIIHEVVIWYWYQNKINDGYMRFVRNSWCIVTFTSNYCELTGNQLSGIYQWQENLNMIIPSSIWPNNNQVRFGKWISFLTVWVISVGRSWWQQHNILLVADSSTTYSWCRLLASL